jgi:pimeloyl-ACP methyl ester carboxylesterase
MKLFRPDFVKPAGSFPGTARSQIAAGRIWIVREVENAIPCRHGENQCGRHSFMIPVGPYRTLKTPEGADFPYYIIPFDKDGRCEGPKTLDHLIAHAQGHSDVFLFSHGWNNDWSAAIVRYESFIRGFMKLRSEHSLPAPANYRPLVVGIFWPSQALNWFESEQGPEMAALDPAGQDAAMDASTALLHDIANELPPGERTRFCELVESDRLEKAEATELAGMLSLLVGGDDEAAPAAAPSAGDLLAAAEAMAPEEESDYDEVGTVGAPVDAPQAAFGIGDAFKALDPRNLVKPFTVWHMKDRAGKVGSRGVAKLLEALLSATAETTATPAARVHLIGHSFGCKVVMSATCAPAALPRPVESALLLQPAISQYAFASEVPERGVPGGFHHALQRVKRPIMATFSSRDVALSRMFHLSLRRHDDLGELKIAGGPPSRFGAMGGFGPRGAGASIVAIRDPMSPYDLSGGGRIIGVDGTRTIGGHGDISHPSAWWAVYSLVMAHQAAAP